MRSQPLRRRRQRSTRRTPVGELCEGTGGGRGRFLITSRTPCARASGCQVPYAPERANPVPPTLCIVLSRIEVIQQGGGGSPPLRSVPFRGMHSLLRYEVHYTAHLHRRRSSCGMREGVGPATTPSPHSLPPLSALGQGPRTSPSPSPTLPSHRIGLRVPRRRRRRRRPPLPLPLPLPLSTPFGHARSSPWRFTST